MPIPVSVTGWNNDAGAQAGAEELTTAGPFARLAQAAPAADTAAPAQPQAAQAAAPAVDPDTQPLLEVKGLSFWYSGLGARGRSLGRQPFARLPDARRRADGRPQPGVGPIIDDISFGLPRGACCLLLGSNGAGALTATQCGVACAAWAAARRRI